MRNLVLVEVADPVDLVVKAADLVDPVDLVADLRTLLLHLRQALAVVALEVVGQAVVVLMVDLHSRFSRINGSLHIAKVLRLYSNLVAVMVALFLLAQ